MFNFCISVLVDFEKSTEPLTRETTAVLNRVLTITEQVLGWEFFGIRSPRTKHLFHILFQEVIIQEVVMFNFDDIGLTVISILQRKNFFSGNKL